jgi:hypothetical protein
VTEFAIHVVVGRDEVRLVGENERRLALIVQNFDEPELFVRIKRGAERGDLWWKLKKFESVELHAESGLGAWMGEVFAGRPDGTGEAGICEITGGASA